MTCADCDLSGRCKCVMRRLERQRSLGLISHAEPVDVSSIARDLKALDDVANLDRLEIALQMLRDLNKG
ncbi:MAG TPA: hypothetical protein VL137_03320 [Polyangiaceae bacterium]|nr:hypothetical protein [Polyangiaceae bacterium]